MAESYTVTIKLVSNDRPCHAGHEVGQEWKYDNQLPAGMCSSAWYAIFPYVLVMANGGAFPWQEDPDVNYISCPDHLVRNTFELRRTPRETPRP